MMDVRVPPNNTEAEQSILSSMLYENSLIQTVAEILKPSDLYRPDNREICAAIFALYKSGRPVDVVTLKSELMARNTFETIGGIERIAEIVGSFYTTINTKYYAQEVKRCSETRFILKSLVELTQKHETVTVDDIKALCQAAEDNQYIKSYTEKSLQSINEFKQNLRVKKQRIMTGFGILDAITGGFKIPSVAMIGAYPSVGKTAFALNIAAKQKKPVVFFSLEMSNEMIYERLASAGLKIDYRQFAEQDLSSAQYAKIERFADELKNRLFHVFDEMYFIEQHSTIISNIKPSLVVVDYVQKVKTHMKIENRRLEIDYISGMYKQIAKQNNCVVLLLSQLSRDKSIAKPTMSQLKESGSLEADGDYVGILHRPYVMQKDEPDKIRPEDGYILIDKNKFGNTGQINLKFIGHHQQFYEVDDSSGFAGVNTMRYEQEELITDESELPFL